MATTSLTPGVIFAGDFRIVSTLGEGGMGAVYIAEQRSTGKQRALKTMHPQFVADAGLRERFAQEARIGARIDSEHVVDVVAAGIDADTKMPWLAMELLKGETVAESVEAGRMGDPHFARAALLQLGEALALAHAAGVVHRDLKPENLFLATTKRNDVPFVLKVLDFGIAKLVSENASSVTATIGTPMWMAPEQTELGAAITPATDVWAYGLIAFYVLTGQSYWHLRIDGHDISGAALLRQIVLDALPSASARAAELGIATALPDGFDVWFARCAARRADARFPDGAAASHALAAALGVAATGLAATVSADFGRASTQQASPTPVPRGGTAPLMPTPRPPSGAAVPIEAPHSGARATPPQSAMAQGSAHTDGGIAGTSPTPLGSTRSSRELRLLVAFGVLAIGGGGFAALGGGRGGRGGAGGGAASTSDQPTSSLPSPSSSSSTTISSTPLQPRDGMLFSSTPIELKWSRVDPKPQAHDIEVARAGSPGESGHAPPGVAYAMWPWPGSPASPGSYAWRVRETEGQWSNWATFSFFPSVLDRVLDHKKLRVGMETTYHEPFTYYDGAQKKVVGFDVDLAEEIASRLGVTFERVSREWKECFTAMETRELDVVVSAVSVTPERARKYAFSDPYLRTGVVVTTRATSKPVAAPGAGRTVGAQRDTTAAATGRRVFTQATVREYDTLDGALASLARSEIDALLSDETVIRPRAEVKAGGYRIDGKRLTDDAYAVMMPFGDEPLRARVNAILKELAASGRIAELKKAYGLR